MNKNLKSALLFFLMASALCFSEQDLKSIDKNRSSFLKELSNLHFGFDVALQTISNNIHSLLQVPEGTDSNYWLSLLKKQANYPLAENLENYNQEETLKHLRVEFTKIFKTVNQNDLENGVVAMDAYLEDIHRLIPSISTAVQKSLKGIFAHIINAQSITNEDIKKIFEDFVAGMKDELFKQIDVFLKANPNRTTDENLKKIQSKEKSIGEYLYSTIVRRFIDLTNLYLNPDGFLKLEAEYGIVAAQIQNLILIPVILERISGIMHLFSDVSAALNKDSAILSLYDKYFDRDVKELRKGSSIKSIDVQNICKQIFVVYVKAIDAGFGPERSFSIAQKYLKTMSKYHEQKSFTEFINNYVKNLKNFDFTDYLAKSKDSDLLMLVSFVASGSLENNSKMLESWSKSINSFDKLFLNPKLMSAMNIMKTLFINYVHPNVLSEYWGELYKVVQEFVISNYDHIYTNTWHVSFVRYLDSAFESIESPKSVRTYYFMWKLEAISYIPKSVSQEISFVNFAENAQEFESLRSFITGPASKDKASVHLNNMIASISNNKKTIFPGAKFSSDDLRSRKFLISFSNPELTFDHNLFYKVGLKESDSAGENLAPVDFDFNIVNIKPKGNKNHEKLWTSQLEKEETSRPIKETSQINNLGDDVNDVQKGSEKKTSVHKDDQLNEIPTIQNVEDVNNDIKELSGHKNDEKSGLLNKSSLKEMSIPKIHPVDDVLSKQKHISEHKSSSKKHNDDGIESVNKKSEKINPSKSFTGVEDIDEDEIVNIKEKSESKHPNSENKIIVTEQLASDLKPEELDNYVELMAGQISEDVLEQMRKAPELIKFVQTLTIKVDPITNVETHIYYIQIVPHGSDCYNSIFE